MILHGLKHVETHSLWHPSMLNRNLPNLASPAAHMMDRNGLIKKMENTIAPATLALQCRPCRSSLGFGLCTFSPVHRTSECCNLKIKRQAKRGKTHRREMMQTYRHKGRKAALQLTIACDTCTRLQYHLDPPRMISRPGLSCHAAP